MEPYRDDTDLAATLRTLRTAPRPEFAAALDARAAAGFPPDPERESSLSARVAARLRAVPTRRLLVPAGGFAAAAIVVATAVVAISTGSKGEESSRQIATATPPPTADRHAAAGAGPAFAPKASAAAESTTSGSSGTQFEAAAPTTGTSSSSRGSGPFASQAGHRDVERSSQIVLGADPSELRTDAAKVFAAVHAYDGIVLRSSVSDGAAGEAEAEFDLLIPSGKLGDALAAFSRIAEVRSRQESSQDITAPTVNLGEHLQDSRAKIEGLLGQLAEASNDGERDAVEAELRSERARAAALRTRLTALERRANLSHVSLRIETGQPSASGLDAGGPWGIEDALGDAGRILAIAGGVTLIGLAVVGPLALIGLLAWASRRLWVQRRRAQALC